MENIINTKAKGIKLEFTYTELYLIFYAVKRSFFKNVKDHWVFYPDIWKENEKERLSILKMVSEAMGQPDLFNEVMIEQQKFFDEFNKKQENGK